jgi:hypothetical protein
MFLWAASLSRCPKNKADATERVPPPVGIGCGFFEGPCFIVAEYADKNGRRSVFVEALKSGRRIRVVSEVRTELALVFVKAHGLSYSERARQPGVSAPAIAKAISRKENQFVNKVP